MTEDVAAARIRTLCGPLKPRLGLVLGSGLGGLASQVTEAQRLSYTELPGFPRPGGVAGHAGELVVGRLAGVPVICLNGRAHFYEGHGAGVMAPAIRSLKAAGLTGLILTNAAGSLRREVAPGRVSLISDHINFLPGNPLVGPNDDTIGPRFFSMRDAYDPALRKLIRAVAADLGVDLAEGVYLAYSGPNFETPAEIRAFRVLGADLVGMSTVPEVLVARHCGLRVAAFSVVTNLAEGMGDETLSHEHTQSQAVVGGAVLASILIAALPRLEALVS